jgi:hypothetical protein
LTLQKELAKFEVPTDRRVPAGIAQDDGGKVLRRMLKEEKKKV